jgi:hypothetical protein
MTTQDQGRGMTVPTALAFTKHHERTTTAAGHKRVCLPHKRNCPRKGGRGRADKCDYRSHARPGSFKG